jgi:hypothetical protein
VLLDHGRSFGRGAQASVVVASLPGQGGGLLEPSSGGRVPLRLPGGEQRSGLEAVSGTVLPADR